MTSLTLMARIRTRRPVIHCITNLVTIGRVADTIAAVGGRPVMATAPDEAAHVVDGAQALLLNMGTPSEERWSAALLAGRKAIERDIPIILDPVGSATSPWRMAHCRALVLGVKPSLIRGNVAEIAALAVLEPVAGTRAAGVSVDASGGRASAQSVATLAERAAAALGCVVMVTGSENAVSDGHTTVSLGPGHPVLEPLVGAGDVLDGLIACCLGAGSDAMGAAEVSLEILVAAARQASSDGSAPGSLWARIMDTLGDSELCSPSVRDALAVYVLADTGLASPERLPDLVSAAIAGGATLVQLRAKGLSTLDQVHLARAIGVRCRDGRVPFLVNDRVDVALAVGADGAHVGHLGQEDLSPEDARRLLGPRAILGVSVGSDAEAIEAERQGANYVSAGPMFATSTKGNAGPPAGVALLRAVRAATTLPLVVIGGITPERAGALIEAGADGVCVGSAVLRAENPAGAAAAVRDAVSASLASLRSRSSNSAGSE